MNDFLYDKLKEYCNDDYYPFHMPGHKRNIEYMDMENPYFFDITEIDGFDNLHHANDLLKEAQERAARLYNSEETHFLINGSTAGILSAISACVDNGILLMARNSHKAVYNAVFLNKIENIYTYPQKTVEKCVNCGLLEEDIKQILDNNKNIQSIMITSPTYDGVVSNVREIAKLAHERGIPLIVDEAHGAHFHFSDYFPQDSIKAGADIVINSVHKTMPALTQTALLHINGKFVNREKIRDYLAIYQTSSPSYVLMSSIDKCIRLMDEKGNELFNEYIIHLDNLRKKINNLKNISIIEKSNISAYDYDKSKIVISTRENIISGKELYDILLKKYHLQMEMCSNEYCIAMTSVMDTDEGYERLYNALHEIDEEISKNIFDKKGSILKKKEAYEISKYDLINEKVMEIWQAKKCDKERILLEKSIGKISAEYIYLYPPGIPLLTPGEKISDMLIQKIKEYKMKKLNIEGMHDFECKYIEVIKSV